MRAKFDTTAMQRGAMIAITIALATALPGCADYYARQQAQYAANAQAQDDDQCRSYGVQPGSPAYVQCRMNLDNQRAGLAQAAVGAFFANGGVGGNR